MSYSKIVSGMPGFQTLWKRSTALGSQVGPNAQMIYTGDRVQAPAGSTFYAPLNADTVDHKGYAPYTFTRASPGLYQNQASEWQTAANNIARFENGMLLMEPEITNICRNYNASPDEALTNVTLGGTGTLERVDDSAALAAAGLDTIGNGYAIRIASSGAAANANVTGGAAASTKTISAWIKKIGATGFVNLRTSAQSLNVEITNQEYQRISISGPVIDGELFQINTSGGGEAFFLLNQFEESPVVTSPIITQGASASRAVDDLSYAGADSFFNQAQGMAVATFSPGFSKAQSTVTEGLLTLITSKANLMYYDNQAFRTRDGSNIASHALPNFAKNDSIRLAVLYGPAGPSALDIGYSWNGAAWDWGTPAAYDGAFDSANFLQVARAPLKPEKISNVVLFDVNRGRAWIEANYP